MTKISGILFVVLVFSTTLIARPQESPESTPDSVVQDVVYATVGKRQLTLDLHYPTTATPPYPVVMWIHGGAWQGGSHKDTPAVPLLTGAGYVVASITYRFSQEAIFPAQIHDCKAAIRWLRVHGDSLYLATERIGVWGESAGGHLAALLGTSAGELMLEGDVGELNAGSAVQAVVDWYGPTDFLQMDSHALPNSPIQHDAADSPESRLVGGPIREKPNLVRAANPITYITTDDPPFLIMHGQQDPLVPPHQSELLADALKSAGIAVSLHLLPEAGHGGDAFRSPEVLQMVVDFFDKYIRQVTPQVPVMQRREFYSRLLQRNMTYRVYLPPAYDQQSNRYFPVLYWLHDRDADSISAEIVAGELDRRLRHKKGVVPMIVAAPDCGEDSWYTDWQDGAWPIESVLIREFIPHIDSTLRTILAPEGRALEGIGMGGYGAAKLGFQYPERFGVISILNGRMIDPTVLSVPVFAYIFGDDTTYRTQQSPWHIVNRNKQRIRGRQLIRIVCSSDVPDLESVRRFRQHLTLATIVNRYTEVQNAGHNIKQLYRTMGDNPLGFFRQAFSTVRVIQRSTIPRPSSPNIKRYVYKTTLQGNLVLEVQFPPRWRRDDYRPAVVFFFGGGWRNGTLFHFLPQAEYFADRGLVTIRADYRIENRHGTRPDKSVEDGKSVIRWLRVHAAELGIDPQRIVVSGGSAGGHVAACIATVDGFEASDEDTSISSKPNLQVLFNPVLNTVIEQWQSRFGSVRLAVQLSPAHQVSAADPPALIFFGTDDGFSEGGTLYLKNARELHNDARLYWADNQKHGFFNNSPWLEQTIYLMDQFLIEHHYLSGSPTVTLPGGRLEMYRHHPIRQDTHKTWK